MRPFARPGDARFRGSAHSLRSAYNHFTLVEPFPNGNLFFKRVVDRPVCVYVIGDRLFILASELQAFTIVKTEGACFCLRNGQRFYTAGDYVDEDTFLPAADWSEAKAWECFELVDPPTLDQRDRAIIAHIDQLLSPRQKNAPAGEDEIDAALITCLASADFSAEIAAAGNLAQALLATGTSSLDAKDDATRCFHGRVDVVRGPYAAGWAAQGDKAATVTVYVNGMRVGEAYPHGERPDVADAGFARFSAWSFFFPQPPGVEDRLAFRFPDGSPLRSDGAASFAGALYSLRSACNQFVLCETYSDGNLYFKRDAERPVCVYLISDKLFALATRPLAFTILPAADGRFNLRSTRNARLYSLGHPLDDDTFCPEANRIRADAWELFDFGKPPRLDQREHIMIAQIDELVGHGADPNILARPWARSRYNGLFDGCLLESLEMQCSTNKSWPPVIRVGLCAIVKDEDLYLEEWVSYHFNLGFDLIYLYDNGSCDQGCMKLALDDRFARRLAVKTWPTRVGFNSQASAYNDFHHNHAQAFDWILILDIDEFLVLKAHDSVQDFLSNFQEFDGIAINWKMFGSSGALHFEPGLVIERFTHCSAKEFEANAHIKTFFRPNSIRVATTHSPDFHLGARFADTTGRLLENRGNEANMMNFSIDYSCAQVNHYFTKSYDEFVIKRNRGKADHELNHPEKYRSIEEFYHYDRNEEEDLSILKTTAYDKIKRSR